MTTLRSADELRKQGLYFEYTPNSILDATRDTPTPITPPAIRPRTAQACDKCRERKTKCSGERPTCVRCQGRGLLCHYSARVNRNTRTRTVSPPPQKRRERVHAVDPPVDRLETPSSSMSSMSSSTNAYKPYPYPPPSKSYSPRPQSSFLHDLQASGSSYKSELESALLEAPPIAQSLPVASVFEYRRVAGGSSQLQNRVALYPGQETRRNSSDSRANPNDHAQWWNTPFVTPSKSLSSVAMGGSGASLSDALHLGGTKLDPLPIATRPSYAASSSTLNDSLAGPSSHSFFNNRGQYVAAPEPPSHHQQDLSTHTVASYDAGLSANAFLDFSTSFASGSSHNTQSSTNWDPEELALHQPLPLHPQQQRPIAQQEEGSSTTFAYQSPMGLLDLEDRHYSEYH